MQILSVLLAASLARVKHVALYDSEDEDDDDYYERAYGGSGGQRRPLLNRSEEEGGVGGGGYRSEEGGCAETDTPEIPIAESPSRTARRDGVESTHAGEVRPRHEQVYVRPGATAAVEARGRRRGGRRGWGRCAVM